MGSEMCIRDRIDTTRNRKIQKERSSRSIRENPITRFLLDALNERLERDQNDDNITRKMWKNVIVIVVPWQANIDRFNTENRKENMQ